MNLAKIPNLERVVSRRNIPLTPTLSPSDGEREKTAWKTSPMDRKAR